MSEGRPAASKRDGGHDIFTNLNDFLNLGGFFFEECTKAAVSFMEESKLRVELLKLQIEEAKKRSMKVAIIESQLRDLRSRMSYAEKTWRNSSSVQHGRPMKVRKSVATRPGAAPSARTEGQVKSTAERDRVEGSRSPTPNPASDVET